MIKLVVLLKRRAGMSREAFFDYYENVHARMGERHLRPEAVRYLRRYLHSCPTGAAGGPPEPEFDAIMEAWFPDMAAYERMLQSIRDPAVKAEILADEDRVFDRAKSQYFLVKEEYGSDFS